MVSASGLAIRSCPYGYKGVPCSHSPRSVNFRSSTTSPRYIHCVSYLLYNDLIRLLPCSDRGYSVNTNILPRPALRGSLVFIRDTRQFHPLTKAAPDDPAKGPGWIALPQSLCVEFLQDFGNLAALLGRSGTSHWLVSASPLAPSERLVCLEDTGGIPTTLRAHHYSRLYTAISYKRRPIYTAQAWYPDPRDPLLPSPSGRLVPGILTFTPIRPDSLCKGVFNVLCNHPTPRLLRANGLQGVPE